VIAEAADAACELGFDTVGIATSESSRCRFRGGGSGPSVAQARNLLQSFNGVTKGLKRGLDLLIEGRDRLFQLLNGLQVLLDEVVEASRGPPSSASFIGSVSQTTIAFKMRRPLASSVMTDDSLTLAEQRIGQLRFRKVWTSGAAPFSPKRWSARGRPTKPMRRDAKYQPISVKELALNLPSSVWRKVTWHEGAATLL